MTTWPFDDAPNTACFTLRRILRPGFLRRKADVLAVYHDANDGSWQFLDNKPARVSDAMLVSLDVMLKRDPTLAEIANLDRGWRAVRRTIGGQWERSPMAQPEPQE